MGKQYASLTTIAKDAPLLDSFAGANGHLAEALAQEKKEKGEQAVRILRDVITQAKNGAKRRQQEQEAARKARAAANTRVTNAAVARKKLRKAAEFFFDKDQPEGRRVIPLLCELGLVALHEIQSEHEVSYEEAVELCAIPKDYSPSDEVKAMVEAEGF